MDDTIRTKHPLGRSGRTISKERYDAVERELTSALRNGALTHGELMDALRARLKGKFEGNISWYGETVKLDLEARKAIERTATRPPKYRLK